MRKEFAALLILGSLYITPLANADLQGGPPKRDFQAIVASLKDSPKVEAVSAPVGMLQGLTLCLGVFFIGLYIFKKFYARTGITNTPRRMRIKERLSVGPKTALLVVEIDGREFLVGCGAEQTSVTALSTKPSTATIALVKEVLDDEPFRAAEGMA